MTAQVSTTTESQYRFAGWAAIASGVIGLVAYGFLWAFLVKRISGGNESSCIPLIRTHDLGVILQSLFMIPVVVTIGGIGSRQTKNVSAVTVIMGVAALSLIVLCLLLIFVNVISDEMYMVPQGVLGIWLLIVNRQLTGTFPKGYQMAGNGRRAWPCNRRALPHRLRHLR